METGIRQVVAPLTERSAFEAEVAPHYDHLVRRLVLIVRDADAARDLAQAAYLRAFEHRRDFAGGDARAWLFTIGIRLALNEVRRRRRWRAWIQRQPAVAWAMSVDPDLWVALEGLESRQRAALVLHHLEGYTLADIAAALEVPAGTVSSWLSRAKATLRVALREEED